VNKAKSGDQANASGSDSAASANSKFNCPIIDIDVSPKSEIKTKTNRVYFARNAMMTPKRAAPSIKAAAKIIAVWILPEFSGCRAMPSHAPLPTKPIPMPAPMTANPIPILDITIT
jgi:hypothetical protein